MTEKIWLVNNPYFDQNGQLIAASPEEYTEAQILEEYWKYWKNRMKQKYGANFIGITPKNCIADWVTVNWAWEKPTMETDVQKIVELLREALLQRLAAKTGWGRNEVMSAFDQASIDAVVKYYKASQQ